jgi:hypothetical protein
VVAVAEAPGIPVQRGRFSHIASRINGGRQGEVALSPLQEACQAVHALFSQRAHCLAAHQAWEVALVVSWAGKPGALDDERVDR